MGTPAEYCQNAHDCLDIARHSRNDAHRKLLRDLASKWFELAGMTRREIELLKDAGKKSAA